MEFEKKLKAIILENISDEQFGVGELADKAGISRSTLLRKLQKESHHSAGQLIKSVRLNKAIEILEQKDKSISEVAYEVGFSSTSYFIKCFREEYGTPPGEYLKTPKIDPTPTLPSTPPRLRNRKFMLLSSLIFAIVLILGGLVIRKFQAPIKLDKSIAVLPFKNNSQDQSNLHVVNGLMDAILNHLQKIQDLRVVSRTSAERYRNSEKSIKQIADEIDVSYFVEGSGQKIGNRILLNIQLIDGKNDRQIWSGSYEKNLVDIFKLQRDVASIIATQVEAKITPEELQRIEEIPTENLIAYDYFLQGLELTYVGNNEDLEKGIPYFEKAIEEDQNFSRAYAAAAIAYYYLDIFKSDKEHGEIIEKYAEKAYLLDPKLPQSLVAKSFSYMIKKEYSTAVTYLEKALEYHPNSAFVINFLSDFYSTIQPNTGKYLEYSLKGLQLDKASNDSVVLSFIYLHVSNAFLQTGFIDDAIENVDKSLTYNENNTFSKYLKAYTHFAKTKKLNYTNKRISEIYQEDTTRYDVLQELAKTYYNLGDYQSAWQYYEKLLRAREEQNLSLFVYENIKIAYTCKQLGYTQKEAELIEEYRVFTESDQSIYNNLAKAGYNAYLGNTEIALDYLEAFTNEDNYHYWVLFMKNEPHLASISSTPRFNAALKKLEDKFWNKHEEIKANLKSQGLIQ